MVLCLVAGEPAPTLLDDFAEIADYIDVPEIIQMCKDYYNSDLNFQQFVEFLSSPEFRQLWTRLMYSKALAPLVNLLIENGLRKDKLLDIRKLLNLQKKEPEQKDVKKHRNGGIKSFLVDLREAVVTAEVRDLILENLHDKTSNLSTLFNVVKQIKFEDIEEIVRSSKNIAYLTENAQNFGIDINRLKESLDILID